MKTAPMVHEPGWVLESSAATRTGVAHTGNEDAYALLEAAGLFAVADGVGGLAEGAVASRAIVEVLNRMVSPGAPLETRVRQAEDALHHVNEALFLEGRERDPPVHMGSTIALLLVGEAAGVCLWAGDSRVYLQRGDELHQLTHDHSVCEHVAGSIHPRNAITRAIGPTDAVEIDCCVVDIEPDDTLLMCTDGVSNWLDQDLMRTMLAGPMDGLAARVVNEAVARGSRDDATAVIVRVHAAGDAA